MHRLLTLVFTTISVLFLLLAPVRASEVPAGHALQAGGDRTPKTLGELPASARDQIWSAIERDRYSAFAAERDTGSEVDGPHVLKTDNPAQAYHTEFGEDGVFIQPRGASTGFGMRVSGWGYGDRLEPLPVAVPTADATRIEYARGPVSEWYINRKSGIEQGFTLFEPPAGERPATNAPLNVELALSGDLTPDLSNNVLTLKGTDSETGEDLHLRYGGLKVWDATGRILPSRMQLADARLTLSVDDAGARYPVTIDPVITNELQKLLASDAHEGDQFGASVAVYKETVVVGAPLEDPVASSSGSAYVFVLSGGVWIEQQKLVPSIAGIFDQFGTSVAISGETVIVGARNAGNGVADSGAAYVFDRSGGVWSETQILSASDAALDDQFGASVSLSGDVAVIGAQYDDDVGTNSGSAYVFRRDAGGWVEVQKLIASDGAANDFYGNSVSISGETIVVGAPGHNLTTNEAGAAYVYFPDRGNWKEQEKLVASDASSKGQFGSSVSIDADTIVVGAPANNAAYVFVRSGSTWSEEAKLTASDGIPLQRFGVGVSIYGDLLVVGTDPTSGATDKIGAVYVFSRNVSRNGVNWDEIEKLTASDGFDNNKLGSAVSVFDGIVFAGAYGDGVNWTGAAYYFQAGLSRSSIVASVLPNARAMQIGSGPVTAFATILNAGSSTARACKISLPADAPAWISSFLYQTTDASNAPTGTPDTPVDIPVGTAQGFYFAIDSDTIVNPDSAVSENLALVFDCANTDPVAVLWGVNTFAMTASPYLIADMVAVASTIGNTGYITIPATGSPAQEIATAAAVNIGSTEAISVEITEQADNGPDPEMEAQLLFCQSDAAGICQTGFVTSMNFTATSGQTYYFVILAIGTGGDIADDPAINRVHLYFRSSDEVVGATSVAVRRTVP